MDYIVISDEYTEGGYYEPEESGRDCLLVMGAKNATNAKWVAIKHWRKTKNKGQRDRDSDKSHPLTGMKVIRYYKEDDTDGEEYNSMEVIKLKGALL